MHLCDSLSLLLYSSDSFPCILVWHLRVVVGSCDFPFGWLLSLCWRQNVAKGFLLLTLPDLTDTFVAVFEGGTFLKNYVVFIAYNVVLLLRIIMYFMICIGFHVPKYLYFDNLAVIWSHQQYQMVFLGSRRHFNCSCSCCAVWRYGWVLMAFAFNLELGSFCFDVGFRTTAFKILNILQLCCLSILFLNLPGV